MISQRSTKTHKETRRICAVITNRFGGIVDLVLLLHSSKNQGVWVDEWGDLDEFVKCSNGGERERGSLRLQGGRKLIFIRVEVL
jgi:hypothetical protein